MGLTSGEFLTSSELKKLLSLTVGSIENVLLHDLSAIVVDEEWSNINDATYHIDFIRRHILQLINSLKDKNESESKEEDSNLK